MPHGLAKYTDDLLMVKDLCWELVNNPNLHPSPEGPKPRQSAVGVTKADN